MEKIGENNQKVGKTCWILNQTFTLGLEHNKIEDDGPQISCWKTCCKGYDGANAQK